MKRWINTQGVKRLLFFGLEGQKLRSRTFDAQLPPRFEEQPSWHCHIQDHTRFLYGVWTHSQYSANWACYDVAH
jgi:hypothetical protein